MRIIFQSLRGKHQGRQAVNLQFPGREREEKRNRSHDDAAGRSATWWQAVYTVRTGDLESKETQSVSQEV